MFIENKFTGGYDIPESDIITMIRPILGFEHLTRFALIETIDMQPFALLQSVDDPATVFLMVDPRMFVDHYEFRINRKEIDELSITDQSQVTLLSIVTFDHETETTTINLPGSILINRLNHTAKQLVLTDSQLTTQYPITETEPVLEADIQIEEAVYL